jgi:hypothetical protein
MNFQLILRSYAPFSSFGVPPFHGDARGPTTSPKVTSRLKAWVNFDPVASTVSQPDASCDETLQVTFGVRGKEIPKVRIDSVKLGKGWMHFRLNTSGANPLLKPASPDIDLHLSITVSLTKQHLNVNAELKGDAFPNAEVMVMDSSGARRMIYTFETSGGRRTGPIVLLPADVQRQMNAICMSLPVNDKGLFV